MNAIMKTEKMMSLVWCLVLAYAACLLPIDALADTVDVAVSSGGSAGGNTIGRVLCNVVHWFNGKIGQGIATLAIIVIGIGALMGKVSWGMAIIVGIGVAVIFGAGNIVQELGTPGTGC